MRTMTRKSYHRSAAHDLDFGVQTRTRCHNPRLLEMTRGVCMAVWSGEYQGKKGQVQLYVYRKRAVAPSAGDNRPVLFFVHGSSASGRSSFDLHVPGRADYSLMDHFAGLGYDVWTMDHEGYGRSDRTQSNSDISSGADDLAVAMTIVERETGQRQVRMYGGSSGALRAALYAQRNPGRVERLMVSALVYTGAGSPTLEKRREKLPEYRASHVRKLDRPFVHSMFTRDKPGTSEMIAADALADAELALGNTIPNGTYLDMCANLPVIDPVKIACPVQILRGEYDGIATEADLLDFFGKLPSRTSSSCSSLGSRTQRPSASTATSSGTRCRRS
jgi:pimeloyl-ACP methyl ester carboxylesterase